MSEQVTLNSDMGPINVPRVPIVKAVDPSERSQDEKRRRRKREEHRETEKDQITISETARSMEGESTEEPSKRQHPPAETVSPKPAHDDTTRQMEHNIWSILQQLGISPDPHDIDSLRASLGIDDHGDEDDRPGI